MIKVDVKVTGIDKIMADLSGKGKKVAYAASRALTKTAHSVRTETVKEMQSKLDRPTNYTTRQAIQVEAATNVSLTATVGLGIKYDAPSKGTPYAKALGHLFTGGSRAWKKMEGAFRRIQALPPGYMMVPGSACPLDAYGNPSRGLVVQLITYFNASSEQGFKANMSDKRRRSLAKMGSTSGGYRTINGVQYFISYGRRGRPGGDRYVNGRSDQHLPAGIWLRTGIHGSDIKPIFLFVRQGTWAKRIDLPSIGKRVVSREWQTNFKQAMADEMRRSK